MSCQQSAQNHDPAFGREDFRRRDSEFGQREPGEAVEGENIEPRVTGYVRIGEDLAFDLKGGLFWGEEYQRRAGGISAQGGAYRCQAAEGLQWLASFCWLDKGNACTGGRKPKAKEVLEPGRTLQAFVKGTKLETFLRWDLQAISESPTTYVGLST